MDVDNTEGNDSTSSSNNNDKDENDGTGTRDRRNNKNKRNSQAGIDSSTDHGKINYGADIDTTKE